MAYKITEETRRKLRESHLGIIPSEETRKKMSESAKKSVNRGRFVIGNAGYWTGKKRSEETIKKIVQNRTGKMMEEKHFAWKGDKVSYRNLHRWVERRLGKPEECMVCNRKGNGHHLHWANKSRTYKRIITDWVRLCVPCHKAYDRNELALQ